MLVSLVLYGSRARGDHRQKSDVDLLGVIEEGPIHKELSAGGTSLYHYPHKLLLKNSSLGDLFVLHIVSEGIVLHDSLGAFKSVQDAFVFKENYSKEICDAYIVIKFFEENSHLLRKKDARKRLVWAIRTVLIARCAERRKAYFSSDALARASKIGSLKRVIDNRNLPEFDELLSVAIKIRERFAQDCFPGSWPSMREDQRQLMKERGGLVADTLKYSHPTRLLRLRNLTRARAGLKQSDYC